MARKPKTETSTANLGFEAKPSLIAGASISSAGETKLSLVA